MLNDGQTIAADTMHAVDQFILCKTLGTKMFTHLDINNIVKEAMMADAMIGTIGINMGVATVSMMDVTTAETMAQVMGIMAMARIEADMITVAMTEMTMTEATIGAAMTEVMIVIKAS